MKKSVLATLCMALVLLQSNAWSRTLDEILQSGTLKIGVAKALPWVIKKPSGELMGSEIDLADRLVSDLGVDEQFVVLDWGQLVPALQQGRVDLVLTGFSITPHRALLVDFSRPYSNSTMAMVARHDQLGNSKGLPEIDKQGIKIGTVSGTVAAEVAQLRFSQAEVLEYPRFRDLVRDFASGELSAIVASQPLPQLLAADKPALFYEPLTAPLYQQAEGIAVQRGNQSLLNFLNAWVEVNRANGFLARTHDYWFNSTDWFERIRNDNPASAPTRKPADAKPSAAGQAGGATAGPSD